MSALIAKLYDPARFSIVIQNMQYARRKPPKPAGLYP